MSKVYLIHEEGEEWEGSYSTPIKVYLSKEKAELEVSKLNEELTELKRKNDIIMNILDNWSYCDTCESECRNCQVNEAFRERDYKILDQAPYCIKELELIE